MAASSAANATCTPTAADNVIATCTGASGTYGTGVETGVNVTVDTGASVSGGSYGINVADGIFVNGVGASIVATAFGIRTSGDAGGIATSGNAVVTNSGIIQTTTTGRAIDVVGNATVVNTASGSITGGAYGIFATGGSVDLTNSGSVSGVNVGVRSQFGSVTATNNLGASITGGQYGIVAGIAATITNSGSISGTYDGIGYGISADSGVTVTNTAGATITGGHYGIAADAGSLTVTNSGSIAITGTVGTSSAISAGINATVTNNAGGSIAGGTYGIRASNGSATVINTTGASITGVLVGVYAGVVDVTNFGSITSASGIAIRATGLTGHSSVVNAGTISGGLAAIGFHGIGNTLTLLPGSVITGNVFGQGSDTFQLGGTGAASFDISTLGATLVDGQYRGFNTFNKIDSSVWTLTGTSTFAGPVNVNGGTLSVNGDLTSVGSLTVNAGGTLGGNGIVGSTAINGGALAPGNSIGLLTVSGSLTFTAASSYLVEVSPANADRVNVTGTATLGGATVYASFAPGSYVAKQYTILHADGGVNGTFSGPVNTNLPSLNASLSYDTATNNVYLGVALGFTTPGGLNVNQQNVADALTNSFNSNGGIPAAYAALTAPGLTQASGEVATGSQQTTFDAMNLFLGVLTDPFVAGRGAPVGGGAGASPFAAGDNDDALAYAANGRRRSERDAYAAIYRKAPLAQVYEPRWSVWAASFGGTQTTDGNATLGSNTATSRIAGGAAGADYWFSPSTVAGFALAGGGTNFSVANSGTGRSDLFQAGAFVRHNVGPAYVTAALAYGWQDITTDRTVTIAGADHLQARFNANTYSGRVEAGYRFIAPWIGGVGLTPYAAGQFTTFDLPAYAEQVLSGGNAFALSYASKSVTASRTELGLRADKSFALKDAILTLRGRAAWAHDFNPDRSIAASFQALPGASFVVNGAAQARDAALTTASAEVKFANGLALAATFEGEFSDVTASYAGKGMVRYAW